VSTTIIFENGSDGLNGFVISHRSIETTNILYGIVSKYERNLGCPFVKMMETQNDDF